MYDVTYTIDGIVRHIMINAKNNIEVTEIFTNMFSGQKVQIINIVRK